MEGNTQRDLTGSSDARELLRRLLANPTCSVDDAVARWEAFSGRKAERG